MVNASCFCKKGEGGTRARFISMPGHTPVSARNHQCAMSPLTSQISAMQQNDYPHTNFKGLTATGKAYKVAELIAAMQEPGEQIGDDSVSYGYDKSANDRTWYLSDWAAYQNYLYEMAGVIAENAAEEVIAENFAGSPVGGSKYRLQFYKYILILKASLAFLLSGVNGTELANRSETISGGHMIGNNNHNSYALTARASFYTRWPLYTVASYVQTPLPVNNKADPQKDGN